MRKIFLLFVIPAILAAPAPSAAGELKLTIQNGLVTLNADDVPLSMIMAEWARIGQTKIVNGEKMMTRVSLNLVDVPERRALDVLLRSASGFMAAERRTAVAGASVFDSIMILPTSTPPANTGPIASPPPTFVPRPMMPQPQPQPQMEPDEDQVVPPGAQQPPVPGAQPTMPGQNPAMPNAPLTAPRPGQLPAPAPQQPVPFGTQRPPGTGPGGVPIKPGGGGGQT
jgi:hypothetical protein